MLLHTDFITCFLVLSLELFQYIWNISKMIKLSKSNKYRVTQKTFSGLKMRRKNYSSERQQSFTDSQMGILMRQKLHKNDLLL